MWYMKLKLPSCVIQNYIQSNFHKDIDLKSVPKDIVELFLL
jgi:hypothetical protein